MYNNANKEFYSELEKILKTARLNYLNCNYHVMGFELLSIKWGFYILVLKTSDNYDNSQQFPHNEGKDD
jgi:hypothetical protein